MRAAVAVVLMAAALTSWPTALPLVAHRLTVDLPIQVAPYDENAALRLLDSGRPAIVMDPVFALSPDRDMLAYVLAHEVAHFRRGHLAEWFLARWALGTMDSWRVEPGWLRRLLWPQEYEADADAVRAARRAGLDAVRGARTFFALYGDGGGWSHPPDQSRLEMIAQMAGSEAWLRPAPRKDSWLMLARPRR